MHACDTTRRPRRFPMATGVRISRPPFRAAPFERKVDDIAPAGAGPCTHRCDGPCRSRARRRRRRLAEASRSVRHPLSPGAACLVRSAPRWARRISRAGSIRLWSRSLTTAGRSMKHMRTPSVPDRASRRSIRTLIRAIMPRPRTRSRPAVSAVKALSGSRSARGANACAASAVTGTRSPRPFAPP